MGILINAKNAQKKLSVSIEGKTKVLENMIGVDIGKTQTDEQSRKNMLKNGGAKTLKGTKRISLLTMLSGTVGFAPFLARSALTRMICTPTMKITVNH